MAEDDFGNVDPTFNGLISLALSNDPGNATLGGPTSVKAQTGLAVIWGLAIGKAGNGYALTATSGTLTAAVSQSFDVT